MKSEKQPGKTDNLHSKKPVKFEKICRNLQKFSMVSNALSDGEDLLFSMSYSGKVN